MNGFQAIKNFKRPLFAVLCTLIFTSLCFAEPARKPASVLKISDGDTIWVLMSRHKVKLRLLGIDTPEKFDSKKLDKDVRKCSVKKKQMKRLGVAATHYAEKLMHKGDKVEVASYGRGYYGRTLAMLYLSDGSCYNERIVKEGYACLYKYHGHKSKEIPLAEWETLSTLLKNAKRYKSGL